MRFESNVFINCPFDAEYDTLLKPLIYTIIYFNLEPRLSQTVSSGIPRIEQIKKLIKESKFSIHDLSRCKPLKENDLPRFNMPFELGLDMGCFEYGGRKFKSKKMLILETDRYHYQKILSDIAGQDIENHDNDFKTLINKVRNWFSALDHDNKYPLAADILLTYVDLIEDLNTRLKTNLNQIPIPDFIKYAKDWIAKLPKH